MNYEYVDRSRIVYDELEDEEMRISVLKVQTRWAIEEATAKNLLTQAKLNKMLTKLVPGSPECLDILRTLTKLYLNWEELIELYEETAKRDPLPWDEDYEAMEHLIAMIQKFKKGR